MKHVIIATLLASAFAFCSDSIIPYNLDEPARKIILPDTLREISDITALNDSTVACIQDENGIVFFVDFKAGKLLKQFQFGPDGDYEGICVVKEDLYVLRSDGLLFHIKDYEAPVPQTFTYNTGVRAANNEGLCYDRKNDRLLIAVKGKSGKGPRFKDIREIYGFSLAQKKLQEGVAYRIGLEEMLDFAAKNNVPLPVKPAKKKRPAAPVLRLTTSAIGIRPDTQELYLISSTDRLLLVIKEDGTVNSIKMLDRDRFNKPEGLTFTSDHKLLISNEAQKHVPTLLVFEYR